MTRMVNETTALVELALDGVHRMYSAQRGLFPARTTFGGGSRSMDFDDGAEVVRGSLICLLGLSAARRSGYPIAVPVRDVLARVKDECARMGVGLSVGEWALLLWVEASVEDRTPVEMPGALRPLDALDRWTTMHLAWALIGLSAAAERQHSFDSSVDAVATALGQRFHADTGLFVHASRGPRRWLPAFPSEIYPVYALLRAGRVLGNDKPIRTAIACALTLCGLQRSDGGYPWLYDAASGRVVEPYDLFSVHQHGMAPMALNLAARVTGDPRFAAAVTRGLGWLEHNALQAPLVDRHEAVIYRGLRRAAPLDEIARWVGALRTRLGLSGASLPEWPLTVVRECWSYELGWLLYAWAGHDAA